MTEKSTFEQALDKLIFVFSKQMQFMKVFNLDVLELNEKKTIIRFPMSDNLLGNVSHQILHGGVTASVLDSAGGIVAMAATLAKNKLLPLEEQLASVANAATIDLRIDYLRPGKGSHFIAEAEVLRCGSKITAVQARLHNDKNVLIAVAMATYLI